MFYMFSDGVSDKLNKKGNSCIPMFKCHKSIGWKQIRATNKNREKHININRVYNTQPWLLLTFLCLSGNVEIDKSEENYHNINDNYVTALDDHCEK